jgi:hypothetical protein
MSLPSLFDETTSEPVTLNEQSHQAAGRVANKYRQRAGRRALFKPAVITAIDLDQLARNRATPQGAI